MATVDANIFSYFRLRRLRVLETSYVIVPCFKVLEIKLFLRPLCNIFFRQ
jgi:hypothetical protein